jgi:glycosyltransferase involved in cell wall biosynthesis
MIFLSKPEQELANRVFSLRDMKQAALGAGVNTGWKADATDFKDKYHVDFPYLLYAGRKDAGKNIDILLKYFDKYKKRNENSLKLVLIGGGEINIPITLRNDILDLGFLSVQDKYNAYAGSVALCQPSKNESFSLVIMESWLSGRPVLVHADCDVTRNFVIEAQGGLYFGDYYEFEGCLEYFMLNIETTQQMGKNGLRYVEDHFTWEVIVQNYMNFFCECIVNE